MRGDNGDDEDEDEGGVWVLGWFGLMGWTGWAFRLCCILAMGHVDV